MPSDPILPAQGWRSNRFIHFHRSSGKTVIQAREAHRQTLLWRSRSGAPPRRRAERRRHPLQGYGFPAPAAGRGDWPAGRSAQSAGRRSAGPAARPETSTRGTLLFCSLALSSNMACGSLIDCCMNGDSVTGNCSSRADFQGFQAGSAVGSMWTWSLWNSCTRTDLESSSIPPFSPWISAPCGGENQDMNA